ncbi:MAG: type II toxin-antitoxin system VapC family toxin [Blastocatellia bacterium]|nr:type II toxin-antitoxin system VapC family toxin [Blastocatellia bacterium]
MNLVVDTSVIIAVIADEPEKPILITKTEGFELFAPYSLYWEIGNAFSAMLKRQRITLEQAKAAVTIYRQIPLNLVEIDLEQALELANRHKIYAYDAYIIACAINQNCALITLDRGLGHVAKAAGIDVVEVK